jgi:HAD superfamily hydrolase (TIGR01509 family)
MGSSRKVKRVIEAVLFDLDETLILDEAVCEHAFRVCALSVTRDETQVVSLASSASRHARRLWLTLPEDAQSYAHRIGHSALEGLWARYDPAIPGESSLEAAIANFRTQVWVCALEECGVHGDPARLAGLWVQMRSRYPLYPDADELLVQLKDRYKLGIVTNGVRHLQRQKLEGCGLLPWFDAIAVSGEVGIGKPERGIFEWVAGQLHVPLEACVMVGDNAARDVQGGNDAGMPTIWVKRGFKPAGSTPTLEVHDLLSIVPWLASHARAG